MILCLIKAQPNLLLKLFNSIFDSNAKINQWSLSVINPIFKSGSKSEPNNYGGISLISCLGKLFTAILYQRLMQYALEKKIIKTEQLGFLQGRALRAYYSLKGKMGHYFVLSKHNTPPVRYTNKTHFVI